MQTFGSYQRSPTSTLRMTAMLVFYCNFNVPRSHQGARTVREVLTSRGIFSDCNKRDATLLPLLGKKYKSSCVLRRVKTDILFARDKKESEGAFT